jgi:hypothetical protein
MEYSGSSAEQMAGSGWQTLIHTDDLERHAGKWREALATGKPHENEVRSRRSETSSSGMGSQPTSKIANAPRKPCSWCNDLQDSKAKLEEAQRIAHVGYWVCLLAISCGPVERIVASFSRNRPRVSDVWRHVHDTANDTTFLHA